MKLLRLSLIALAAVASLRAAAPDALPSQVFSWDKLAVQKTATGEKRDVVDSPTQTLAKLSAHISTLNPGERSSAPRLHLQEEVIFVKEGQIEATFDGHTAIAGPGSMIFFEAHAVTSMKNVGTTPATYLVLNYFPQLAAK